MTGGHKPRARHTHPRRPARISHAFPRPRPAVTMDGGPLAGLTIRIDPDVHQARTMRVPGHCGRYVQVDGDMWSWEIDHHPERNTR